MVMQATQLDRLLRSIVDYPAVDLECKKYATTFNRADVLGCAPVRTRAHPCHPCLSHVPTRTSCELTRNRGRVVRIICRYDRLIYDQFITGQGGKNATKAWTTGYMGFDCGASNCGANAGTGATGDWLKVERWLADPLGPKSDDCGRSCKTDSDCDQTAACNRCENMILGQCVT